MPMFIAMNRFQIVPGEEEAFETIRKTPDSQLEGAPAFVAFHQLRGPSADEPPLYPSHARCHSREDFEAWTKSENFRKAHANAGGNKPLYLGHPRFEGFEVAL